jgi:hypothetical protein
MDVLLQQKEELTCFKPTTPNNCCVSACLTLYHRGKLIEKQPKQKVFHNWRNAVRE